MMRGAGKRKKSAFAARTIASPKHWGCMHHVGSPPITDWPGQPLQYDRSVPKPGQGHAWIQWKGTDVCMDVRCRCGAHGHVDASFAYFYKCLACGDTFAVGQTVRLYALDEEYAKRHQGVQPVVADGIVDAEGKPLDELKVTYTVITEDES